MANKIIPDFFTPNEGRVCEATVKNIDQAKSGNLRVSAPFLTESAGDFNAADPHTNPVTGSKCHYALYDWFHQFNTKKAEEVLRKCSLVNEIAGIIDTQVVEQLFSSSKRDIYFINNYCPTNHLFLFRLICHLRNENKNSEQLRKQNTCFNDSITLNEFGQLCQKFSNGAEIQVDADNMTVTERIIDSMKQHNREMEVLQDVCDITRVASKEVVIADETVDVLIDSFDKGQNADAERLLLTHTDNRVDFFIEYVTDHKEEIKQGTQLTDADLDGLCDLFMAAVKGHSAMTETELQNFNANVHYARNILFQTPAVQRGKQVQVVETLYGPHYIQGPTNYCGLCCVNNALYFLEPDSFVETSINEIDSIADKLWVQMANNPALGVTCLIEVMRDLEGFYSIEVLTTLLEQKHVAVSRIDPRTIHGLNAEETGLYIINNIQKDIGFVCLILRPRREQHWVAITAQTDILLYRDSHFKSPRLLTLDELGNIICNNVIMPGSVFFLSKMIDKRQGPEVQSQEGQRTSPSEPEVCTRAVS